MVRGIRRSPDERGLIAVVEGHVRGCGFVEADDLERLDTPEAKPCWRP